MAKGACTVACSARLSWLMSDEMLRTFDAKRAFPSRSRSSAAAALTVDRATAVVYTGAEPAPRIFVWSPQRCFDTAET